MRNSSKLAGGAVLTFGVLAFWLFQGSSSQAGSAVKTSDTSPSTAQGEARASARDPHTRQPDHRSAEVSAAVQQAVREYLKPLGSGEAPRLGLAPEDLVPIPVEERPTPEELAEFNRQAAAERERAPRPERPDPNLLIGLLAAVGQVTENPGLRSALANNYLDAIRGFDEPEASEWREKLEKVALDFGPR